MEASPGAWPHSSIQRSAAALLSTGIEAQAMPITVVLIAIVWLATVLLVLGACKVAARSSGPGDIERADRERPSVS